jgi:hypothetical protein
LDDDGVAAFAFPEVDGNFLWEWSPVGQASQMAQDEVVIDPLLFLDLLPPVQVMPAQVMNSAPPVAQVPPMWENMPIDPALLVDVPPFPIQAMSVQALPLTFADNFQDFPGATVLVDPGLNAVTEANSPVGKYADPTIISTPEGAEAELDKLLASFEAELGELEF